MATSTRDKIIGYAAKNINPGIIASSCGVTPAYVSQLLELQDVRDEIARLKSGELEVALEADSTLERLETKALKIMEQKLPFVKSAVEAVKIAQTLNGMKRKAETGNTDTDVLAAQQVIVVIPKGAALHFRTNENNQVIEVEGRAMAPLPSRALPDLQKRLALQNQQPVTDMLVPDYQARNAAKDQQRAASILRDLTTSIDGVEVVL
jgi:hypothetical protein